MQAYEKARTVLTEHLDVLHKLAEQLLEKETILGAELDELIRQVRPGIDLPEKAADSQEADDNADPQGPETTVESDEEEEKADDRTDPPADDTSQSTEEEDIPKIVIPRHGFHRFSEERRRSPLRAFPQTATVSCGPHTLELGPKTRIMGIVNITPDSFSDGGHFFSADRAVAQGLQLVDEGADILDIGGESTRPFSDPVSETEELERVLPVIEQLAKRVNVPISIDTTKAKVARRAVAAGATIINDISALRSDPQMAATAAECRVPLVLMHMKGTPKTMQVEPVYEDLIGEIKTFPVPSHGAGPGRRCAAFRHYPRPGHRIR